MTALPLVFGGSFSLLVLLGGPFPAPLLVRNLAFVALALPCLLSPSPARVLVLAGLGCFEVFFLGWLGLLAFARLARAFRRLLILGFLLLLQPVYARVRRVLPRDFLPT